MSLLKFLHEVLLFNCKLRGGLPQSVQLNFFLLALGNLLLELLPQLHYFKLQARFFLVGFEGQVRARQTAVKRLWVPLGVGSEMTEQLTPLVLGRGPELAQLVVDLLT